MRTRRQRLGQHFLSDARVATAIAAALPPNPPRVIEIGPGRGALTRPLLARFERVLALEIDDDLARMLPGRLGRPAGLEVVRADALEADFDALTAGERFSLAGNLPYSVGTPIVRRLLPRHDLLEVLVVMVQKEVAERLCAPAGHPERGLLSCEVEAQAEARLLFVVPASAFEPPPKVTSAVVELRLRAAPIAEGLLQTALVIASRAFSQRRKQLAGSVQPLLHRDAAEDVLRARGFGERARPQELALADWIALAQRAGETS